MAYLRRSSECDLPSASTSSCHAAASEEAMYRSNTQARRRVILVSRSWFNSSSKKVIELDFLVFWLDPADRRTIVERETSLGGAAPTGASRMSGRAWEARVG